jgi:hypothetical protein
LTVAAAAPPPPPPPPSRVVIDAPRVLAVSPNRNPLGLPTWVLVLGALGVIAVVWYVTQQKGGRAWKRRRPF